MKILHVLPAIARTYGGPSEAIVGLTSALASRGLEVHLATTTAAGADELKVPIEVPVSERGVTYYYFPRQRPRGWTFSWPLTRWLSSRIEEYDVVHVHALFSYPSSIACFLARKSGIPYVLRPLGALDPWCLGQKRWKKVPYVWLVERRNLTCASAVHATSRLELAAIQALNLDVPVVEIPLGVNLGASGDNAAPVSTRNRLDRKGSLLFVGRLHPKKGLELLIEAMALLSEQADVRLIVAGEGDQRYVSRLKERVRDHGLEGQVEFPGFVHGPAKVELFRQADLFVLPSHDENFGLAVAEAMASGIPVVVSDRVGLAPDIKESEAGVVVSREPRALAKAILSLIRAPDLRRAMGIQGRHLVRRKFNWNVIAGTLEQLYRRVVQSRFSGRAFDVRDTPEAPPSV